jgi:cytochrome P450
MNLSANSAKLPPGPHVPAAVTWLTRLSPKRLEFDSLKYITDAAKKFGRFYGIYAAGTVTLVLSDPKLIHEVLVERHDEFHKADLLRRSVGNVIGNGLLTSEDDVWRRQRKLAQPAFHYQRIETYATTMVQQTQDQLAEWQPGQTRDIAHDMMALALGIVNKTLFNVEVRDKADRLGALMYIVLESANDRLNAYDPLWERIFKTRQRREQAALAELNQTIIDIIAEHRRQTEDAGDLLSMLLAARDEDGQPMSEQQLRDEVMTLFVAGHETTANAIAWALYLLAQHPEAEAKFVQELAVLQNKPPTLRDLQRMPYSEMIVKEAMRLYPPAGGATREPLHAIELGGYRVPKGTNIAISTYTMHRDPDLFPNPLQFDPERFSPARESEIPKFAYLPFGAGPRVCIGNMFAMMESRLVLITIAQRFKLSLAPNQPPVRAEQLFTIRPKGGLHMLVQRRANSSSV